jgi:methylated-DNA-[protein]-cysteine S-methyltransferase
MNKTLYQIIDSPIGPLTVLSDGSSLIGLYMNVYRHGPSVKDDWVAGSEDPVIQVAGNQLGEFFAGTRMEFDLPLNAKGTEFQRQCWNLLSAIPYGETWSYGEMAKRLGSPEASRAVGAANGQNPISIVVPCHRVIGSNGKLVGFGGGIPRKAALLAFERAMKFGESGSDFWAENPLMP